MENNNRLRKIRIKEGLTQSELSQAAEVSTSLISKVESKGHTPSEVIRSRLVYGLNKVRRTEEEYIETDLFPETSSNSEI